VAADRERRISVIFGLILMAQPGTGALALLYVIGIYAILYGILEIWLSLRLRRHATSARAPME
jgi:uncharacterized membrane protein HdeD (DUF308 family)